MSDNALTSVDGEPLHDGECPACGSKVSTAQIRVWAELVGFENAPSGKVMACALRTVDGGTMVDDKWSTVTVKQLHCDDCDTFFDIQPMRAVVRLVEEE